MKLSLMVLVVAGFVGVYCDCGCLTCSKNLRVVSPPSAPCKVIHRGYSCQCPKSIPYTVQVPKPICRACPTRTYGYKVETVDFVKPKDPGCSYTYDVQVPVKKDCGCKYLYGLVAAPDRIVMPAVDDCIPPKPTCQGPVIEYLPRCDDDSIYKPYIRGKRESIFKTMATPKTVGWREREAQQPYSSTRRFLAAKRRPADKPFRVSIPLFGPRRRFFPFRKSTRKSKEEVDKRRLEANFIPDTKTAEVERKRHAEILQKWGKFADVSNVEIRDAYVAPHRPQKTRKTRSLAFDDDAYPFYQISESTREAGRDDFEVADENLLESKRDLLMRPFDIENLLPHTPFFYLINAPIRALNHFHKLREHVSPVVKSVPAVLDTSGNYLTNFGRKLEKSARNLLGSVLPGRSLIDFLLPIKREKRDKSTIFKVVDEDDVHEFLREKLSLFTDDAADEMPDEDFLAPVTYETVSEPKPRKSKPKNAEQKNLIVEKLTPKLTFDFGQAFVDVNGVKRPISKSRRRKPDSLRGGVNDAIANLIEEAKLMATQHRLPNAKFDEIEMPLQVIKERISRTLNRIEKLIDADFDDNSRIYEELLRLQVLKGAVVDHWKAVLISQKHNDLGEKIRILNSIREVQSAKDQVVEDVVESLLGEDSFDSQNLIKMLIRLQKLQCILVRIVEDFGEKIQMRTSFDVQREIKYVDYLEQINFVAGKNNLEVGDELRRERDARIEKYMALLENLKNILGKVGVENYSSKIDEIARQLWEVRNLEKLQRETISELDDKLRTGHKIRRELKILFDLQKQLEICEEKQNDLFKEILGKGDFKFDAEATEKSKPFVHGIRKKIGRNLLGKKPPLKWAKLKSKGTKGVDQT